MKDLQMKLMLDRAQRLTCTPSWACNGSIRAIWNIQDRIALDAEEEKAVEVKREMVAGQERVMWNPTLSLPAKEFDCSDQEVARLN
jgi:hypothetical protein